MKTRKGSDAKSIKATNALEKPLVVVSEVARGSSGRITRLKSQANTGSKHKRVHGGLRAHS